MEEILRHVSMDYYVITIILNFVFLKMDISSRNVATEFEVLALSQENLGMKRKCNILCKQRSLET